MSARSRFSWKWQATRRPAAISASGSWLRHTSRASGLTRSSGPRRGWTGHESATPKKLRGMYHGGGIVLWLVGKAYRGAPVALSAAAKGHSMADDEFSITALVTAAGKGEQDAWNDIVIRFSPLLVGVLRQCRLSTAEIEDVAQTVWLRLVEHLDSLREAQALPMWIITTGRREAWRHAANGRRVLPRDPNEIDWVGDPATQAPTDDRLLRAERQQALLAGLAELKPRDRELILMFLEDPPPSYAEISRRTGIAVGGIGPTRARILVKLRRTPALRAVVTSESECCRSALRVEG